jgi:ferredoxin-NADP reductase
VSSSRLFRVASLVAATPEARIVRLALDGQPFEYRAGQAALLGTPDQDARKPYSFSSAPEETARSGLLEFLVKIQSAGEIETHLLGLRRGATLEVVGPFGSFQFPPKPAERHFLFIAGGTGIAPLRSMLRHALLTGLPGRFAVLYSARTPQDFAYATELRRLARAGRIRLELTATREAPTGWRGHHGRIDRERLEPLVEDPATLCFLCGPRAMLVEVPQILQHLGVSSSRIRMEER